MGRPGRCPAQGRFQRHRPAINARLVAGLDKPAWHAGIGTHGATVGLGHLVVLQHGLQDKGGKIAVFDTCRLFQAVQIVVRDFDRRLLHQGQRRLFQRLNADHDPLLSGRRIGDQAFARPDDGEVDRLLPDDDVIARLSNNGEGGGLKVAFVGEILAKMGAA